MQAELEGPAQREVLEALGPRLAGSERSLPPMPETVLRVQPLLDSPDCDLRKLAREIERDAALATRLVAIANSPFYAGLERVGSIEDAVLRVGLREARNLIFALSVRSKLFRIPGLESEVADLWGHALAAGLAARELAAAAGLDPEPAFLLGLVHDAGRIVVLGVAASLLRRTIGQQRDLVARVEDRVHAALGELLALSWNLAPELACAIRHHHEPQAAPPAAQRMSAVLAAADGLAKRVRAAGAAPAPPEEIPSLGLDAETAGEIEAQVSGELSELSKLV